MVGIALVRWAGVVARGAAVMLGALILLVPVAPETSLSASPMAGTIVLGAYTRAVPGQLYLVLKSVILWVPLGMLYAFARKQD